MSSLCIIGHKAAGTDKALITIVNWAMRVVVVVVSIDSIASPSTLLFPSWHSPRHTAGSDGTCEFCPDGKFSRTEVGDDREHSMVSSNHNHTIMTLFFMAKHNTSRARSWTAV